MRSLQAELIHNALNAGSQTSKYYGMFSRELKKELDQVEANLDQIQHVEVT